MVFAWATIKRWNVSEQRHEDQRCYLVYGDEAGYETQDGSTPFAWTQSPDEHATKFESVGLARAALDDVLSRWFIGREFSSGLEAA